MGGDKKMTTNWNSYFICGIYTPATGEEGHSIPHNIAVLRNIEVFWIEKRFMPDGGCPVF